MFENIKNGKLKIPHTMTQEAKHIINRLMNRNPAKRLGSGPDDALEIKEHPFFAKIDWDLVLQKKLPVPKPNIKVVT